MKLERLLGYLTQLPPDTDVFVYSDIEGKLVNSDDRQFVFYLAYEKKLFFGTFTAFTNWIEEARAPKSNA